MLTSDEWEEAERNIVRAWSRGDSATALAHIQRVLNTGTAEQRGRALMYRGSMHEEAHDGLDAKGDFIQAAGLLPHGSYVRYTAELLRDVLAKSWRVLHLPGEPDLDDLSGTTNLLRSAGWQPR